MDESSATAVGASELLKVRQPHELGSLPLVEDVVDADLAQVEYVEVVGVRAGILLLPVSIAHTLEGNFFGKEMCEGN